MTTTARKPKPRTARVYEDADAVPPRRVFHVDGADTPVAASHLPEIPKLGDRHDFGHGEMKVVSIAYRYAHSCQSSVVVEVEYAPVSS